jgi:hypothetical protein
MTNEEIARLIVNAYNMGKEDGHDNGYEKGYNVGYTDSECDQTAFDNGYEKGYEAARDEFEVVVEVDEDEGEDEKEDEEEMSSAQIYDAGWNDGYEGRDRLYGLKEDPIYMWGYKDGRGTRIAAMK